MLFRVFEIKQGYGYTFLIGPKSTPTNKLREEIGGALAGVWAGLFEGESRVPEYGFELIPDKSTPTGETELPPLVPNNAYMIFVLLESDGGSAVGELDTTRGIIRAIEKAVSRSKTKPRIGVVTLYNCSVQKLESQNSSEWGDTKGLGQVEGYKSPWGDREDFHWRKF